MEHIDRQAIYFSLRACRLALNLCAAITALTTEVSLMAYAVGLSDGSAAAACGKIFLVLLSFIAVDSLLWRIPDRSKQQLIMSVRELWSFTAMTALTIFLAFTAICMAC